MSSALPAWILYLFSPIFDKFLQEDKTHWDLVNTLASLYFKAIILFVLKYYTVCICYLIKNLTKFSAKHLPGVRTVEDDLIGQLHVACGKYKKFEQ